MNGALLSLCTCLVGGALVSHAVYIPDFSEYMAADSVTSYLSIPYQWTLFKKLGNCPRVGPPSANGTSGVNETVESCESTCSYDVECHSSQKCCKTGCGTTCVDPLSKFH